ncbi:hypothetical protein C5Z26_02245 [Lactobacillus sp. CBA3606]|uniref:GDSL-type esterase/lipase family protein n=1 Tax=Lactobacillus sp. CBA3606 TaxID=2099789 RepID=UPI000CFD15A8|nr:GDSL-type esterase/lipase family protein [Lactobacillus sp. CBA3606]AVK63014.1 hypothetical protein C5Z26_02245 [Lactobacillus sp. CBA3606]
MVKVTAWRQMVANFPNIEAINQSHKQVVQIKQSLGTHKLRLEIANDFGATALVISQLEIRLNDQVDALLGRVNGQTSFSVPAHQRCWTDWLTLPVQAGDWLRIVTVSPTTSPHTLMQTLDQSRIKLKSVATQRFFGVDAIEVERRQPARQLLFFGDSLTNQGYYSAALTQAFEKRFPDQWGVINGGISGNRLLRPGHSTSVWGPSFGAAGLDRLAHLLVAQPVDQLIFMAGLNDLLHPGTGSPISELPTAAELIAGLLQVEQLAAKTQTKLIRLTVTPFKTSVIDGQAGWTVAKETRRQAVNHYLGQFDTTIDVASYVAAPADPARLAPEFDCGDHIHFSATGGQLVADYIASQLW